MRRKTVCLLVLCLLLAGCGRGEVDYTGEVAAFSEEMEKMPAATIEMQKKLARWYNGNLRSAHPDVGFERSYDSILFFEDGMLGYVEIPGQTLSIPIYHNIREDGFFQNPYSAFPTGGEGNQTKLHTDRKIVLREGELFYIHILQDVLAYQVGGAGEDKCLLICDDVCYEGTRMVED